MPKLTDEYNPDDEEVESEDMQVDPHATITTGRQANVAIGEDGYAEGWPAISAEKRAHVRYQCQRCGIDLSDKQKLLHVHHLDHNRLNNEDWNLLAVCVLCHSTFPKHHQLLQRESQQDLDYLRALQLARSGKT